MSKRFFDINPNDMPGLGDPETWGPVTNHPNDPRNDSEPEDEYDDFGDDEYADWEPPEPWV